VLIGHRDLWRGRKKFELDQCTFCHAQRYRRRSIWDIEAMTKHLDQAVDSSPETWTRRTAIRRIAAAFSAAAGGTLLPGGAEEA